jgi:deoxyadenosine/deoxycytidine kinase
MSSLINITGPIAAGATTLANRLVELMSWESLIEADVEKANSFFPLYSTNPQRYAFHNQITFLLNSAESHRPLHTSTSRDMIYVQDFCPFEHTEVYAYVQQAQRYLSNEEYTLLLRLTGIIELQYRVPDILIYRPLSQERLLQRIQERGRRSEQSADFGFLDALRRRFDEWIEAWTRSPIIRVDEHTDFLTDADAVYQLGTAILDQRNRRKAITND